MNLKFKTISGRKLLLILFMLLTQFTSVFSTVALAQTVTPLPTTSNTQTTTTPAPSDSQIVNADFNYSTGSVSANNGVNPTFATPANFSSAQIRLGTIIRNLAKHGFRADEKVGVLVSNPGTAKFYAKVYDVDGKEVQVETFTEDQGTEKEVVVVPPVHFRPGKYTVTVTTSDGQTFTQDFTWGVLAINTNKSIYSPNESAKIAIGVLNDNGEMVCSAKVDLIITGPNGNSQTLSTDNGSIKVNDVCNKHDPTLTPDYETSYQTSGIVGKYQMNLSAQTPNGDRSITDSFEVRSYVPFDVERSSATRIYPPLPYPVDLNIVANQDFSGTVTEVVPSNFAIDQSSSSDKPFTTQEASQTSLDTILSSDSAKLGMPFAGFYPIEQEFGEQILKDPTERQLYSEFNLAGHDGVDFGLPDGTPVLAADDGKVSLAGPGAYGTTIVIDSLWGRSYYGHLSFTKVKVGDRVKKGDQIGLSGHTGLATGPHLHFGMKPWNANADNGYYGKIDPLPFLGLSSYQDNTLKVLSWKIDVKKGDKLSLGYFYKAPNISPQFYKIGPLRFTDDLGKNVFEEIRQWQIAVDADNSGKGAIMPAKGVTNAGQQQYDITYTTGESVATGSGAFTISVPTGWTAPQTVAGTAGYTSIDSTSTGTAGDLLDNANSISGWASAGTNICTTGGATLVIDSTASNSVEGGTAIKCVLGNVGTTGYWYHTITSANWTNYNKVGVWMKASVITTATNLQFCYSTAVALSTSQVECITMPSDLTPANVWVWETFPFTNTTRTAIQSYGMHVNNASGADTRSVWNDYYLIGPGSPVITGSGPWTITTNILTIPANTGFIQVNYGGQGAGGVTNSATAGVHTFTMQAKIATNPTNALTTLSAGSPTVTLGNMVDMMRHGKFFSGNVKQAFAF